MSRSRNREKGTFVNFTPVCRDMSPDLFGIFMQILVQSEVNEKLLNISCIIQKIISILLGLEASSVSFKIQNRGGGGGHVHALNTVTWICL